MQKETEYVVELNNITKAFYGTKVLNDVSFRLKKGSVHALMGENGAGKSTLMKILAGIYPNEQGTILIEGEAQHFSSPRDALNAGIAMIHQELAYVPEMTISENMFLGGEYTRAGKLMVDFRTMDETARQYLQEVGLHLEPSTCMKKLTVAQAQMVEIAKAISKNAKVIIMDEPTSAITDREVDILFQVIGKLTAEGRSVIYITHKMDEVFRISDEITVLRDGCYIGTRRADQTDIQELIQMMIDRKLTEVFPERSFLPGDEMFRVENLSAEGVFQDVSFAVRRGEILGLAGLMGAGRTEVAETIFGIRKKTGGKTFIQGKEVAIRAPKDAIRNGIGMVTEDRKSSGLILPMSVKENMSMVILRRIARMGLVIDRREETARTQTEFDLLHVKARNLRQSISNLSGGNQQKVILAKWMLAMPDILILDEPTRGIDVGAKMEIYHLVSQMAQAGKTIIFISSEMEEILGMCDNIVVFHEGRVSGMLSRAQASQEAILKLAAGVA